ncbi:tetratricopeptide repeat protein [Hyphococcus sp.]|jgi:tetratricopeptide (TPR) repeat protein|uniref:tetratricopeptide repeat protein n=1 Tax=Hyphococcus sp. TaxID=2038636 RepID=UPI003D0D6A27
MPRFAGLVCVLSAPFALALTSAASAQMSVTTIGATDAVSCYENARNDFSRDSDPCDKALKDNAMSRADRKKTLVNRGIIYNRTGEVGAAIDDFNTALDLDGSLGEAYLNRGNSYYLMQRYDDALADYEQSLGFDLNKPWAAWYNIGLAYDAQKLPEKAKEAYQTALNLNPDFTQAQQKLEGRN